MIFKPKNFMVRLNIGPIDLINHKNLYSAASILNEHLSIDSIVTPLDKPNPRLYRITSLMFISRRNFKKFRKFKKFLKNFSKVFNGRDNPIPISITFESMDVLTTITMFKVLNTLNASFKMVDGSCVYQVRNFSDESAAKVLQIFTSL